MALSQTSPALRPTAKEAHVRLCIILETLGVEVRESSAEVQAAQERLNGVARTEPAPLRPLEGDNKSKGMYLQRFMHQEYQGGNAAAGGEGGAFVSLENAGRDGGAASVGSDQAIRAVMSVACCSESDAKGSLIMSCGDVNLAVDALVSGR